MTIFPLADGTNDPMLKWGAIAFAVASIVFVVVRPMMRKKDPLRKPTPFSSLAQQRSVERQMQNLLVELSEMARQITAQLDTRSQKLQLLIQEADDKLGQLRDALKTPVPMAVHSDLAVPEPSVFSVSPDRMETEVAEDHRRVYHLADQGVSAPDIAKELGRPRGEIDLILGLRTAMPA